MARFAILASNGFNYEYVTEIETKSARAAREWFKTAYAGDWRTKNFRVSRRDVMPTVRDYAAALGPCGK